MRRGNGKGGAGWWIVTGCAAMAAAGASCGGIVDPAAEAMFLQSLGDTTITVFPAFVRGEDTSYDANAAEEVAGFFEAEGLAAASASDQEVPISGSWGSNQAKMLRSSAVSFAACLGENPVGTEFALLPEYLMGPGYAVGIHCYVIDSEGRIAFVELLNSHHAPFSNADPQTVEDCTEVLISVLREDLGPADSGG
jgi:hypothetical protein